MRRACCVRRAARMKDAGERSDLEAGMAKLFASEAGRFCAEECLRIHGGYGYSKEYEIERIYRDAPLLLIGEGTSEIQRMVIGRKLLSATRSESWPSDAEGADRRSPTRRFIEEVPALEQLKLVVGVELRGARRRPAVPPRDAGGEGHEGHAPTTRGSAWKCAASSST